MGQNAQKSASERCRWVSAAHPKPQTLINAQSERRTRHSNTAPSPARQLGLRAATNGASVGGGGLRRSQEGVHKLPNLNHIS